VASFDYLENNRNPAKVDGYFLLLIFISSTTSAIKATIKVPKPNTSCKASETDT